MKKLLAMLGLFGFLNCTQSQKTTFSQEALQEKLLDTTGKTISFEEILNVYKGKTVVIDIWASWCPDCIKGMPKVVALQKQFPDVVFVFLSYDKTPETWKAGIDKYNVMGNHYLITSNWRGGGFKDALDIDWIPRYIVVDKNGKPALYKAIEADDTKLIETLNTLK